MFVGIVCACMPAASHTANHHLPSYELLRNKFRSYNGSWGLKLRGTEPTSSSFPSQSSRDVKTSRGTHEGYYDLGVREHRPPVPARALQTFTRSHDSGELNHLGSDLEYEMQEAPAMYNRGRIAV